MAEEDGGPAGDGGPADGGGDRADDDGDRADDDGDRAVRDGDAAGAVVTVRPARPGDHDDVAAFTADTWSDRGVGDYLPDVFPDWVEGDGERQRTFVATVEGPDDRAARVVGVVQAVVLSAYEAWFQGMRVHPDYRGRGVSGALNEACRDWARERGAAVARMMVFSWNRAGLAAARANGFEPVTEFRWAHPEPDPDAPARDGQAGEWSTADAPDDAYAFWRDSDASDHLRGLGLDRAESWACSAVTREDLHAAARTIAIVRAAGVAATACRTRTDEREDDEAGTEVRAEYAAASWRDLDACRALFRAVAADAAAVGADRTRVLVPETARHVSDAARAGAGLSEDPDVVFATVLTGR